MYRMYITMSICQKIANNGIVDSLAICWAVCNVDLTKTVKCCIIDFR